MSAPMHFIDRPNQILIGFLKGVFSQSTLYTNLPNEFEYTNGKDENSLIIQMVDNHDQETTDALPCLYLQEGGWSEQRQTTGNNQKFHNFGLQAWRKVPFRHTYTLHCHARERGAAKILQSASAKALIGFHRLLCQLGFKTLGPLQGLRPQRLSSSNNEPGPYDCAIQFPAVAEQDIFLDRYGDVEEAVRIHVIASLEQLTFDDQGNPQAPADDYFEQQVHLDH